MSPALTAVFWTLYFCSFLQESKTSGVFELQIKSFRNDLGLTSNGTCCNGYRRNGLCTAPCRTFFKVCLAHYQADIAANPQPRCTFANFTTPVLGDNTMDFAVLSDLPVQGARQNSFYFPVKEFSWPGDFSLIIEAWHDTSSDTPKPDYMSTLIARLAVNKAASSEVSWYNYTENFSQTELRYSYRFTCEKNYYGANCAELCRPRDDKFGHFWCSANGTKVCLNGWTGDYCDIAVCLPGCDPDNGLCNEPNECKCKIGWQGQFCNKCIPYPGCQRGSCEKPWQCNCNEGWGGLFCNQDLNFCTHNKPCRNGGLCTNTGQGSYTCTCVGSYTGVNCERELDDCNAKPCSNNGICKDIGNGFQCQCPQGFYGRQCEREAMSCKATPCLYGGTCMEKDETYYCLCQPGYTGRNCDIDINECESLPCLNGGRCSDQLNGYRCVCPTGFSGPECQINDDDCKHNPCLNNGRCVDLVNDYRCQCLAGFVGTLCQTNVDDCETMPCANGGSCTDLVNDFKCDCGPGFTGKFCSLQIDECQDNPCLNGGICKDLFADYQCTCPIGFWGKNCQLSENRNVSTTSTQLPSRTLTSTQLPSRTLTSSTPPSTTSETRPLTVVTGDSASHVGVQGDDEGLTTTQLLIIVCLGGGLPLIIIIIIVAYFLCRKRSYLQRHTQQNLENLAREKEHNYINNMNNKCGDMFTTLPSSSSNSSSIKISNEEQQDINKLNAKHMMLSSSSCCSDGDGGMSTIMHISSSKHGTVDSKELPSCSNSGRPTSPPGCSSKRDHLDYEQPFRRLNVDSLQVDTRTSPSEHQSDYCSGDIHIMVKATHKSEYDTAEQGEYPIIAKEHRPKDNAPIYQGYNSNMASPVGHSPAPAQQHPFHRHMRYDDDYLATEV